MKGFRTGQRLTRSMLDTVCPPRSGIPFSPLRRSKPSPLGSRLALQLEKDLVLKAIPLGLAFKVISHASAARSELILLGLDEEDDGT